MKKILLTVVFLTQFISFSFGQFGSQQEITESTSSPNNVQAADLDGDGDEDILAACRVSDRVIWYENDGTGNFSKQKVITKDLEGALFSYAVDIDGDNNLDVLSTSYDDKTIVWYKNDGTGVFSEQQLISISPGTITTINYFDIDGDGDIDVLSGSYYVNEIAWYENDGEGNFSIKHIIAANFSGGVSISSNDINGDGTIDITISSNWDTHIRWYANDGEGNFSFQQQVTIINDYGATNVFLEDLDQDGDNDLIYLVCDNDSQNDNDNDIIAWFPNDGLGNFGGEQIISSILTGPRFIHIVDLGNDGDLDIVAISTFTDECFWFENLGNGNFLDQQAIFSDINGPISVNASDINSDEDIDIISTCMDNIAWQENDGTNNFGPLQVINTNANYPMSIHLDDLDNDGFEDVLVASNHDNKLSWYKNLKDGTFSTQQIITTDAEGARYTYASDLDNDGDMDALLASGDDGKIAWYENDGTGTFGTRQIISPNAYGATCIHACDLDGDGLQDVLSASSDINRVAWFKNMGNGDFSSIHPITQTAQEVRSVYAEDLDSDGDLDVLSASFGNGIIAWYENDGTGTFGSLQVIDTIIHPHSIYASDIDLDGDIDVLPTSYDGFTNLEWYINDGNGNFNEKQIIGSNLNFPTSAKTNDVDADGDIDILMTSMWGDNITIFYNDGEQDFSNYQIISQNAYHAVSIQFCDIEKDGDFDIFCASVADDKITWYENYFYGSRYRIKGNMFYDHNQNGVKDSLDGNFTYTQTILNPNSLTSFTNDEGEFWFAVDTGQYTLSYSPLLYWDITTGTPEYQVNIDSNNPIVDSLDFGFAINNYITDLSPNLTTSPNICGSASTFWIDYLNQGTTKPDGIIELVLDDSISYISSDILPDSIVGQSLYWHFDSLSFFASGQIPLVVQVPDFNSMGDSLTSVLNIYTTDSTGYFFFTDTLSEILACSYDPNDKLVTPKGEGEQGIISKDETLEYTVRFQNTGNAEAINIQIRDQIDENLDIQSIQILAASDEVHAYVQQNRWLVFQFDSILLPDSTTNELESHGFVKYSIRINDDVLPNAQIFNTANIYFDYNPAIVTNTAMNTIECYITPEQPEIVQNGAFLQVEPAYILQWLLNGSEITNATDTVYQFAENGDYSLIVIDENGCHSTSEVYTVTDALVEGLEKETITIFPNPTTGIFTIKAHSIEKTEVFNSNGIWITTSNSKEIDLSQQAKGIYFIKVTTANSVLTQKLIVK